MTRRPSRSSTPPGPRDSIPATTGIRANYLYLTIALVWLVGFSVWFHSFGLPNNQHVPRWILWASTPLDLLDVVDPQSPWSWLFVLQRVPFALTAIAIWVGAWALGSHILRWIGVTLSGCERLFFSTCLGLSSVSLVTLLLGVCGYLTRWPLIAVLLTAFLSEIATFLRLRTNLRPEARPSKIPKFAARSLSRLGWIVIVGVFPFVVAQLLGAMSPQNDFDVVEYHLGGPKEWFQQGHISRLPHNVYTSFPFLTEMLILAGMILYGDWQWGALAGQAVIAGFAPLTAIGLFAAGRRWFSAESGWIAALVYLTSPWTYRISIVAYAEGGLACYLFAALFAALLFRDKFGDVDPQSRRNPMAFAFLAGAMAGSAMACKYTGLLSVVIPIGMMLAWTTARHVFERRFLQMVLVEIVFATGVLASVGPWLLKNTVETGNPVYPLAVRIFGGKDRDEILDAKWRKGHAAKSYENWKGRLNDLPVKLTDVVANNDWHSPLMFGLAPLSLLWTFRRRERSLIPDPTQTSRRAILGIVWLYVAWQFLTWWLFTHHIDRFYVPMFSAVALLAGAGTHWPASLATIAATDRGRKIWGWVAGSIIAASIFYNADIMLHVGGFNGGRLDLIAASNIATPPRLNWLNEQYESGRLPPNTKVLCVGEAQMFHARYPYLYNTVFDRSLFEKLCAESSSENHRLRPVTEIRAEFRRLGITHIDVNWEEIIRYRAPGSYGYTDFVRPDHFAELQRLGLLGPALKLPRFAALAFLGDDDRKQLVDWGPSLITTDDGQPAYIAGQVFPVIDP